MCDRDLLRILLVLLVGLTIAWLLPSIKPTPTPPESLYLPRAQTLQPKPSSGGERPCDEPRCAVRRITRAHAQAVAAEQWHRSALMAWALWSAQPERGLRIKDAQGRAMVATSVALRTDAQRACRAHGCTSERVHAHMVDALAPRYAHALPYVSHAQARRIAAGVAALMCRHAR